MASTAKLLARNEVASKNQDKKSEVAYVREEKRADEEAAKRLAEMYGGGARKVEGTGRHTRGWRCAECGFVNYDIRNVCGECLATNPAEMQQAKPNIRKPGVSQDPFSEVHQVAGRSYRAFAKSHKQQGHHSRQEQDSSTAIPAYREEDDFDDGDDIEEEGDGCGTIQMDPATKDYFMKLRVPNRYWKFIIGTKGANLQETQRLTGATVLIPKTMPEVDNDNEDIITIRAPDPMAIRAAHLRINAVVLSCKDKVEYTHFISIPLGTLSSLRKSLETQMEEIVKTCCDESKNLEPSLFQSPSRLHLTLLMLRLHTAEELAKAISLFTELQRAVNDIFRVGDRVTLRRLNYMNDDPAEVHVVYLEIEDDSTRHKLLTLINTINKAFIDAGLALEKDVAHNEKLHATVVNSKWRKSTMEGGPRESFDATGLFRAFGNVDLGAHRLESIELSSLGGGNALYGYFPSECSIEFPKH